MAEREDKASEEQIELPEPSFENHILQLYNLAIINLGFKDPESGKIIRNLPVAKHTIDTMEMLKEKTKGNLTAPENNLLDNLLYELRMGYLRALKQVQEEAEKSSEQEAKSSEEKTNDKET